MCRWDLGRTYVVIVMPSMEESALMGNTCCLGSGRVPSGHSQKINVSLNRAQLSFLMSCRAVTSTWMEGPMVEVM